MYVSPATLGVACSQPGLFPKRRKMFRVSRQDEESQPMFELYPKTFRGTFLYQPFHLHSVAHRGCTCSFPVDPSSLQRQLLVCCCRHAAVFMKSGAPCMIHRFLGVRLPEIDSRFVHESPWASSRKQTIALALLRAASCATTRLAVWEEVPRGHWCW